MKGRSQRLQTTNPPDDWVDDSWTVDCICGVKYDDGEEMVKCDECGVWVHTRCSRYVKEEELFACDKCKNKSSRNEIEETEVAQFLVELPTKTVRIESDYAAGGPARRQPFKIWTEMPLEEKVHVQGIPGGDPGLFTGLSSVFSQQLWKCTGYVPKKFNFQYKEFPCWDDDKKDGAIIEEDTENAVDKGAGVLFSLSKESVLASPVPTFMSTRTKAAGISNDRKTRTKEVKKPEMGDMDARRSQNGLRKEKSLHTPVIVYSGKRKKEELGMSKELSGKKKPRIIDKDSDAKKRTAHASKAVFAPTSDAKQLEFYEDRGAKSFKTDIRSVKNRNLRNTVAVKPMSDCHIAVNKIDEMPKKEVAAIEHPPKTPSELNGYSQVVLAKDKISHNASEVNILAEEGASGDGCNGTTDVCAVELGETRCADDLNGGTSDNLSDLPENCKANASPKTKDNQISSEMNTDKPLGSQKPDAKTEAADDSGGICKNLSTFLQDATSPNMSSDIAKQVTEDISGNCKGNDLMASNRQYGDKKSLDVAKNEGYLYACNGKKDVDFFVEPCDHKEESSCSEGSTALRISLTESKHVSGNNEISKAGGTVSSTVPSSRLKVAVSLGKSSSTGSSIVISKSLSSNKSKPSDTWNMLPISNQAASDKEIASSEPAPDESKQEPLPKTEKESSFSHASKICHTSVLKRNASESKDCAVSASVKSSSVDATHMPQSHSGLPSLNRAAASGSSQKAGKSNTTAFHPSSKGSHSATAHQSVVSNSPAALSDEELALLLHQELNSSPRVPRVPRIRQTNLPQLASQAASTLHIKRTSSSAAKDQNLVPKRKARDSAKDSVPRPREADDEGRKTGRAASSSDQRRQDRLSNGDASTREAKGSPGHPHSLKKNASSSSTCTNNGPSSSNEANDIKRPSRLASPFSNSDDDYTTGRPPAYRTLPGLINEIMSKGRRMTYEELCDAVLPHWPSLRKHNGERYAYSSHSQAVLDCLRNRHEWAQLVDRGPKTNSSRKRRRADSHDFEEEDDLKQQNPRDADSKSLESQRDDFPKGKRKARRRRRLTLQGRGIKDLRSRRKAGAVTDEDDGAFSNSSEDSIFSEEQDEIQGGEEGEEASSGSEEISDS